MKSADLAAIRQGVAPVSGIHGRSLNEKSIEQWLRDQITPAFGFPRH